jgi:ABC-type uncharacterized transport system ATPase component
MSTEIKKEIQLEIAYVLFIDIVGNKNRGQSTNLDRLAAAVSSGGGNGVVSTPFDIRNSR